MVRILTGQVALGRILRSLAQACLLAFVAGCISHGEEGGDPARAEPSVPTSQFQRHLDRLGVPFQVPSAGKAILVNVPAFELVAFTDGEPVLRSRVIVGTPWHPTPLIDTYTTSVRFRPTWRPTPSMVRSGEYEDRVWPPGRKNPLGLAAVRLEPGLLVYLHDTNRRQLFEREDRALSHGCIRVQRWDALIAWLLDMPLDQVHRLANGRRTLDVPAPEVPVHIRYLTTFPDDAGEPVQYPDVYGRGERVLGQAGASAAVVANAGGCPAPEVKG